MSIGVNIRVDEKAVRKVADWVHRVEELRKSDRLLDDVTEVLLNNIQARFLKEENPDGTKWKPSFRSQLRKQGIKTRGSDGGFHIGRGTYYVSGDLYRSIQKERQGNLRQRIFSDSHVAETLHGMEGRFFMGVSDNDIKFASLVIGKEIIRGFG